VQFQVPEKIVPSLIPHSKFGGENCCGCLVGVHARHTAEIVCNECGAVVMYFAAGDLRKILDEIESRLEFATGRCKHYGSINLIPGFLRVEAFVCGTCGKANG
jgi:hypothetical protein